MENIVRTIYGAYLQTVQYLGLPFKAPAKSTLSELLGINPDISVPSTTIPQVKYLAIGNGGHKVVIGDNNIPYVQPIQHLSRHAGLYNILPLVLRLPTNDLTASERAKYRLRRIENHGGTDYVAYYLKVMDLSDTVAEMTYSAVNDGVTTTTAFTPTSSDLKPTPPDLASTGVNTTTGDFLSVAAIAPFLMSASDIEEFTNVCNIIYGDPVYAMISEIGVCSGVDKVVSGVFNGVTASYTDAIGVQICTFVSAFYAAEFSNTGIDVSLNVGSSEALLASA